jgi:hypothetical protein
MSKTIKLSIKERLGTVNLLNEIYGKGGMDLEMLLDSQNILEKINVEIELEKKPSKVEGNSETYFAIGGKEAKAVNLRTIITKAEDKIYSQMQWDAKLDKGASIEFTSDEVKLLKDIIKGKSDKKELKLEDAYLAELNRKLNSEGAERKDS